jgi:hypothetical protein
MARDTDRLVGTEMFLTIGGTAIKLTKLTPEVAPKFADTSDTGNLNAATGLLGPSRIQVSAPVKIEAEGRYRVSITPSAIIARMFTGGGPYAVTCGPKSGSSQFSGDYDLMNYKQDTPFDDVVTFSCTLESNGTITP